MASVMRLLPLRRFMSTLLRGEEGLGRPFLAHEVRTPRLVLRPYRMADEHEWQRIEDDETIRLGLDWPIRTEGAVLMHLSARTRHTELQLPGDFLVLAIELSGKVIGDVSLHLRTAAPETRTVEIGWLQLASERGHGYATEAARAMLDLAFSELEACLITAVIDRRNIDSGRLARRLGFRSAGGTHERETFILSADDWRSLATVRASVDTFQHTGLSTDHRARFQSWPVRSEGARLGRSQWPPAYQLTTPDQVMTSAGSDPNR